MSLTLNSTEEMKILVAFFLLSIIGLTYATFPYNNADYYKKLSNYFPKQGHVEVATLLNSLAGIQDDQESDGDDDDNDDDDLADIQGIFNVLAQVEMERAKEMDDKSATAQFWKMLGKTLWNAGKGYLKNKYCTEEQEVRAMLQELIGEQEMPEDDEDDDEEDSNGVVLAELQTLFNALKKVDAKMMQDGVTPVSMKTNFYTPHFLNCMHECQLQTY